MPHNSRFQTERRRILMGVILANIVLAFALGAVLWASWERNRSGIEQILQSEATFWADAMNQRFEQLQTTCSVAQRQLHDNPGLLDAPVPWMREMNALMPFIQDVTLVSSQGRLLALQPSRGAQAPAASNYAALPGFAQALRMPGRIQIGLPQPDPLEPSKRITPARCALTLSPDVPHPEVMLIFDVALPGVLKDLQHALSSFDEKGRWVPAVGLLRGDGYLLARLPEPLPQTQAGLARAPARGALARLMRQRSKSA